MKINEIDDTIKAYIANNELHDGALAVYRGNERIYSNAWGGADENSVYRMMSMTKPLVAAGIMLLSDRRLLNIDDPLRMYIPEFSDMRVCSDKRYEWKGVPDRLGFIWHLLTFSMDRVKTVPAERDITLRDLLSHSSGLEQGLAGLMAMTKNKKKKRESLEALARMYSAYALDFQPGKGTGYSPLAGFDMLARVTEVVSGKSADVFLRENLFEPLGMKDTYFKQDDRVVKVWKRKKEKLIDVTGTKDDMDGMLNKGENYISGSGGVYSTCADYSRFARMLLNGGELDGVRILRPETVRLMHTEAPLLHLEPAPGYVWGLGMRICTDPGKASRSVTKGTYGWSGAFGTHFFVSPEDNICAVWVTNRTDLNGSGSYISRKTEDLVFGCFRQ